MAIAMLAAGAAAGQTYADVQAVFAERCVTCHQPGGVAPFSLATYEDIKKRATFIRDVVSSGYMPPWKADSHYRAFANSRSLTPEEKNAILQWIDAQAPEGNTAVPAGSSPPPSAPLQRSPDLVLKTGKPFIVKGDNKERFVLFKVPFELNGSQAIEGLELHTNNKRIIHHINYGFYDVPDKGTDLRSGPDVIDTEQDTANNEGRFYNPLKQNMAYYSGWIPGTTHEFYPRQFGWVLPKRGVLLLTVHYAAIAADEESVTGVKLYFKQQPVERDVRIISLGSGGIGESDITPRLVLLPNETGTFRLRVQTRETQSVMYVWPHMHYLGKSFEAFAVTPAQDTIPLVRVPEWDFRWQELYRMKKLVKIPAGSVIHMTGVYDNTADNPANPSHPPKLVFSSADMRALDEMFTLLMIYVPYREGDENISLE